MTPAPISAARRAAVVSVVKYGLPVPAAKASPESLSTTRLHRLWAIRAPFSVLPHRSVLPDPDPHRPAHPGLGTKARQQGANRDLRVAHEALLREDVGLVEAPEPALDD